MRAFPVNIYLSKNLEAHAINAVTDPGGTALRVGGNRSRGRPLGLGSPEVIGTANIATWGDERSNPSGPA